MLPEMLSWSRGVAVHVKSTAWRRVLLLLNERATLLTSSMLFFMCCYVRCHLKSSLLVTVHQLILPRESILLFSFSCHRKWAQLSTPICCWRTPSQERHSAFLSISIRIWVRWDPYAALSWSRKKYSKLLRKKILKGFTVRHCLIGQNM